jgi:hypothetical protein
VLVVAEVALDQRRDVDVLVEDVSAQEVVDAARLGGAAAPAQGRFQLVEEGGQLAVVGVVSAAAVRRRAERATIVRAKRA